MVSDPQIPPNAGPGLPTPGFREKIITNPFMRAARYLWIVGILEIIACGCFSSVMIWSGSHSADELVQMMSTSQTSQQQQEVILQYRDQIPGMLMMLGFSALFLGMVPGLLYLLLAFSVRKGHRGAVIACMIMTTAQAIVLGFITVTYLLASLANGNPLLMTVTFVLFGTPLALLVWTIRWLFPANLMARHMAIHGSRQMYQQYLQSIGQGRDGAAVDQTAGTTGPDHEPWNHPPQ
jgi:hypothetical protein